MPDGVRYRERSGVSIRRALSEHGSGVKEYDVRFPWVDSEGRRNMRIRYTSSRPFGDVGHDPRTGLYAQVLDLITPGLRVLEIGCGSGSGSSMLAASVGPSGGLVAVDRDGQAIRFARQRHRSDHCAFENGWIEEALLGEIDGGFDAVVGVDVFRGIDDDDGGGKDCVVQELARVLRAGGIGGIGGALVAIGSDEAEFEEVQRRLVEGGFVVERALLACPRSGWVGAVLRRVGEDGATGGGTANRDHHSPGSFQS